MELDTLDDVPETWRKSKAAHEQLALLVIGDALTLAYGRPAADYLTQGCFVSRRTQLAYWKAVDKAKEQIDSLVSSAQRAQMLARK